MAVSQFFVGNAQRAICAHVSGADNRHFFSQWNDSLSGNETKLITCSLSRRSRLLGQRFYISGNVKTVLGNFSVVLDALDGNKEFLTQGLLIDFVGREQAVLRF